MSESNLFRINNLKIGDKVVGQHVDKLRKSYAIVAGEIIEVKGIKVLDGSGEHVSVTYHVEGKTFHRPNTEPVTLSGILEANEVDVIDPDTCNTLIELFDLAEKQLYAGTPYQETVEKIREIRHKSRQELEDKYPAEAQ